MTAFGLSLLLFAFWGAVGWAVLSALRARSRLLERALLSPATGLASFLLLVFELNRFGLRVSLAGPVATLVAAAGTIAILARRRAPLPLRRLVPFAWVILGAALLTGYPLLLHGFDWVSFCNDDMANYAMTAKGFLGHGYLGWLDGKALVENRDPTLLFWLDQILMGARCGSELTLAWVMSVTGLGGHEVFMPTIVSLHLVLVASAGALALGGRRETAPALAASAFFGVSALGTLGTIYQLISQVLGLSLLAAGAVFLLEPAADESRGRWRRAIPGALFVTALGVGYPELLPFLALAFVLRHLLALARGAELPGPLAARSLRSGLLVIGLLHVYLGSTLAFLQNQATKGLRPIAAGDVLFPFFLRMSGLGVFWGFLPLSPPPSGPLVAPAAAAGLVLLVFAAAMVFFLAWRGDAAAIVATVMLALAVRLFATRVDFGLFKLALYLQPFLASVLAVSWFRLTRRSRVPSNALFWAPFCLVGFLAFPTQVDFVRASAGLSSRVVGFVEIPDASRSRLVSTLKGLSTTPRRDLVVSDTSNPILAKFEGLYFAPSRLWFPAKNFFAVAESMRWRRVVNWCADVVRPGYLARAVELRRLRYDRFTPAWFDLHDGRSVRFETRVEPAAGEAPEPFSVAVTGPGLTVLNRRHLAPGPPVRIVPSEQVRNHLVLVESDLGVSYYLSGKARAAGRVAMYQVETDPMLAGGNMSAVGRTLLFRVLGPTSPLRLALAYTRTFNGGSRTRIPVIAAVGQTRVAFPVLGYGSARVVSPPLAPQVIGGEAYVAIEIGEGNEALPPQRMGNATAIGGDVPIDVRRFTGFAREISAIAADETSTAAAPSLVASIPRDLAAPGLEYSGIYEDGWTGAESFVRLRAPEAGSRLVVEGSVPSLAGAPRSLVVLVDGAEAARVALRPGEFRVDLPVVGAPWTRQIDLRFDRETLLPPPDGRPAAALLKSIQLEGRGGARREIAEGPVAIGEGWHPFESWQGEKFRWVQDDAQFSIQTDQAARGVLRIEVEAGPGLGSRSFSVDLETPSGTRRLEAKGTREVLVVPLQLPAGRSLFRIRVRGGGLPTPGDPRILNFRVFGLEWAPG